MKRLVCNYLLVLLCSCLGMFKPAYSNYELSISKENSLNSQSNTFEGEGRSTEESEKDPCDVVLNVFPLNYNDIGSGIKSNPYLIFNQHQVRDLNNIGFAPSTYYFLQCNDIDLISSQSDPFNIEIFRHFYDGNNFSLLNYHSSTHSGLIGQLYGRIMRLTIDNFSVSSSAHKHVGTVVGEAKYLSVLKDLEVRNSLVINKLPGWTGAGALVGKIDQDTSVTRILSRNNKVIAENYCGGLFGETWNSSVTYARVREYDGRCPFNGGFSGSSYFAKLQHISVLDSLVNAWERAGGLVGFDKQSKIKNISVEGSMIGLSGLDAGNAKAGGIIGWADKSHLSLSKFVGTIIANFQTPESCQAGTGIGGIIGYSNNGVGSITEVYSEATIKTHNNFNGFIGGFIGYWNDRGIIHDSYANTIFQVNGGRIGGFAGRFRPSFESMRISNSYAVSKFFRPQNIEFMGMFIGSAAFNGVLASPHRLGVNTFALLQNEDQEYLPETLWQSARYARFSSNNGQLTATTQFYEDKIKCGLNDKCANDFGIAKSFIGPKASSFSPMEL